MKYESSSKDGKCIFCEIGAGRMSPRGNGIIFESEKFLAWLAPFPSTLGHAVVIPRKHYESDVLKMPNAELSEFVLEAKKVAQLIEDYFEDVGRVGLIMEGTGVNHAHIKLVPMHGTAHMKKGEWRQYLSGKEDYFETYPGYLVSHDGPKANFEELEKLAKKIREKK
jgi:diadenosine tetraphosphate (Ap4A) HIT family hydrolase